MTKVPATTSEKEHHPKGFTQIADEAYTKFMDSFTDDAITTISQLDAAVQFYKTQALSSQYALACLQSDYERLEQEMLRLQNTFSEEKTSSDDDESEKTAIRKSRSPSLSGAKEIVNRMKSGAKKAFGIKLTVEG
ncbi:hypothetical protein HDU97_004908 [Phlyctochytrium planicorne]|nr:hypothetical protein HDU97_004908 [Phlyctochytrium planicorne]